MITIIIGKRSNLSKNIYKKLKDSILISSEEVLDLSLKNNEKYNIIINSFQPAVELNNLLDPVEYIHRAIVVTSRILGKIDKKYINKVIYTSSSSVYGDNIYCKESDLIIPLNLHASLKIANEKLIEKFCIEKEIDFTIARIFNMYGGEDNFSIISKIIKSYKTNNTLNIINDGGGIRDFININDVVLVYKKLLEINNLPIINIASGKGYSLREILNYISFKGYNIQTTNINKNEIKISIASIEYLSKIVDTDKFIDVKNFISEQLENVK